MQNLTSSLVARWPRSRRFRDALHRHAYDIPRDEDPVGAIEEVLDEIAITIAREGVA